MTVRTVVYTDGACSGNPGPGGWAWVIPDGASASGFDPNTTNQRMELKAALEAMRAIDGPLEIRSDSTYLVNCFRDGWWEGWLARGWKNSQRKPVANRDLWEPLVEAHRNRDVSFVWVKGHADDRWNHEADRLAVDALAAGRGEAETLPPAEGFSPGARGFPSPVPAQASVDQHMLAVTGHRPPELGGYDAADIHRRIKDRLATIIAAKHQMHPNLVIVTGLALGAETLGAEAAAELGVPFHVVLAHPGQQNRWPDESRRRFDQLIEQAVDVTTLDRSSPDSKPSAAASYRRRDEWIRKASDEALIVWDGAEPLIEKAVKAFHGAVGEDEVWVVDPNDV